MSHSCSSFFITYQKKGESETKRSSDEEVGIGMASGSQELADVAGGSDERVNVS